MPRSSVLLWIMVTAAVAALAAGTVYRQGKVDGRNQVAERERSALIDSLKRNVAELERQTVTLETELAKQRARTVAADQRADSLAAVARRASRHVVVVDSTHVAVDSAPPVAVPAAVVTELKDLRSSLAAMTTARDEQRTRAEIAESLSRTFERQAAEWQKIAGVEHDRAEAFRKQIPRCGFKCGAAIGAGAVVTFVLLM